MLDRSGCVLEEISVWDYKKLRRHLNKPTDDQSVPSDLGFAMITSPLEYKDYGTLLEDFLGLSPNVARRASTKDQGSWRRWTFYDLRNRGIEECVEISSRVGFVYLSFHGPMRKDNEMGFGKYSDGVRSDTFSIPGDRRNDFAWKGSNDYFRTIRGLWVPEEATREMGITPISNVQREYPKPDAQEGHRITERKNN